MRFPLVVLAAMAIASPALADTLIVGNKYDGTVSFIDLDSGREILRPETGGSPHEMVLSPDGKQLVVVSYLEEGYIGEELNVFDVASGHLVNTIMISPHQAPHGIEWIGEGDSVIVTTEETQDVIRVNVESGEVTGVAVTDQIGSHLLALSPDAERAFVTSRGSDSVSVVDVATMTVLSTIDANAGPEAVHVSPDGEEFWVGNNQSEDIIVFDSATLQRLDVIDVGFLPIRVRFHPEGHAVAVADLKGDRIVVYDPASRTEIAAVDLSGVGALGPASLHYAEDGSHLYAGAQNGARVVEIDTADWTVSRVFEVGEGADGIAISPVKLQVYNASL